MQHFLIHQKKSCSDKEINIIKEHLDIQTTLALDLEAKNKALEEKLREAYIALYYKDTFENKKLREELSDARHALDTTLSLREQIKKRKRRMSFFSNPEKWFLSYLKKSLTYLRAIGGIALKSTFIFGLIFIIFVLCITTFSLINENFDKESEIEELEDKIMQLERDLSMKNHKIQEYDKLLTETMSIINEFRKAGK